MEELEKTVMKDCNLILKIMNRIKRILKTDVFKLKEQGSTIFSLYPILSYLALEIIFESQIYF